jgi:hypothetical protein
MATSHGISVYTPAGIHSKWPSSRQVLPNLAVEGLPVILEELKKPLFPGVFSTNRRLIGQ